MINPFRCRFSAFFLPSSDGVGDNLACSSSRGIHLIPVIPKSSALVAFAVALVAFAVALVIEPRKDAHVHKPVLVHPLAAIRRLHVLNQSLRDQLCACLKERLLACSVPLSLHEIEVADREPIDAPFVEHSKSQIQLQGSMRQ